MIGDRIKELRKSRGITQEELARIIGVERSSIGKYEGKSKVIPSDDVKMKLAEYFHVSLDYLCGVDDSEKETYTDIAFREMYDKLTDSEKRRVMDFMNGLTSKEK